MTDIDSKAIDAAVKAMETIAEGSKFPSAYPWRIYRAAEYGHPILLEEFPDKAERDRSLVRIKARVAIEAYLEFMREKGAVILEMVGDDGK